MKNPLNNHTKKIFSAIFTILTIGVLGLVVFQNFDRIVQLFRLSLATALLLAGLVVIMTALNGTINFLLYRRLNVPIPYFKSFGLAAVNSLANQLPFAGGLIAKGVYLKRRYNLDFVKYLSATGALFICFFATNGFVGLIGLLYLSLTGSSQIPVVFILGFTIMVSSVLILFVPAKIDFLPERWQEFLVKAKDGWSVIRTDKVLIYRMIAVQIVSILVMSVRFWFAFRVLAIETSILQCILFSTATILTRLVSIAPGGLGIREGVVAGMATLLGYEPGISALAVGLDRLVATLTIIFLGFISTYFISRDALADTWREEI